MLKHFAGLTGQLWKYRVLQVLFIVALIITVAFLTLWNGNPANLPEVTVTAVYIAVSVVWGIWLMAAIQCPACRVRVVWHHFNHGRHQEAVTRAFATVMCPCCSYDPRSHASEHE